MDPARQKTPEELQAIKEEIAKNKQAREADEAFRKVRNGQIIIFIIAGLMALAPVLVYTLVEENEDIFYIYAPFFLAFLLMGVFYYRNPHGISIAALCVYGGLLVIGAAGDPSQLFKGVVIKAIIIVGLVRAIKYGKDYKVAKQYKASTDLLDDDLIQP